MGKTDRDQLSLLAVRQKFSAAIALGKFGYSDCGTWLPLILENK